jgi:hypothetical protein
MSRKMRRQFLLSAAICIGLLASLSSVALAQDFNAPPGNSGVDQYLETVPEAGGNRPASDRKPSQLPARTVKRLEEAGSDGRAVAKLVASSGLAKAKQLPAPPKGSERKSAGEKRSKATEQPRAVPGTIAAPTLGGSADGGMGILLPLLLGLSTLAALLFLLYRRRSQ